jgi:hypothetical protein
MEVRAARGVTDPEQPARRRRAVERSFRLEIIRVAVLGPICIVTAIVRPEPYGWLLLLIGLASLAAIPAIRWLSRRTLAKMGEPPERPPDFHL